jgi:hypothetical protein
MTGSSKHTDWLYFVPYLRASFADAEADLLLTAAEEVLILVPNFFSGAQL